MESLHPSNIIPRTGNPLGWASGSGCRDAIARPLVVSTRPLGTVVRLHGTESLWPVCACSGKDVDCWSDCSTPSSATKAGLEFLQASFVFLRWRRFRRYLAPSSVATSKDRVPTHLSTFAFTASLLGFPGGTCCNVSPLLTAPRSLAPLVVSKDLSFFLGEKFPIDLGPDNWPEKLRNDGYLCSCAPWHQSLHWTGAQSLTRPVSVFEESEV